MLPSLDFELVLLTSIFMIITSVTIFVVISFFKRVINNMLIEIRNKQLENRSILSNLRKEVNNINMRVSGLIGDVDSLTARVYKLESNIYTGEFSPRPGPEETQVKIERKTERVVRPVEKRIGEPLTKTEIRILELLTSGPKSSREIRDALGLSREHIARELKALYEKGYVIRYTDSKPYVYEITDNGMEAIRK